MRLPFTQIASEIIETGAAELAMLLEWDEDAAGWGLVKLFDWALKRCRADLPPSHCDTIRGPLAARLVATAGRWKGEPDAYVSACEHLPDPPLERLEDGSIRIRGLKRYDAAWKKNNKELWAKLQETSPANSGQVPGGSAPQPAPVPAPSRAIPAGNPPGSARKTQTQTQTQELPSSSGAKAQALAPTTIVPPSTPPDRWNEIDFWAWAQSIREAGGYFAEAPPLAVELERWWSHALSSPGIDASVLKEAFYIFGRSQHWEGADTPFPFKAFMKNWRAFLPRRERAAS